MSKLDINNFICPFVVSVYFFTNLQLTICNQVLILNYKKFRFNYRKNKNDFIISVEFILIYKLIRGKMTKSINNEEIFATISKIKQTADNFCEIEQFVLI